MASDLVAAVKEGWSNATKNLLSDLRGKYLIPSLALVATVVVTQTWALPILHSYTRQAQRSNTHLFSGRTNKMGNRMSVRAMPPKEGEQAIENIHVIVLVHGWLGSHLEMRSIHTALELQLDRVAGKQVPSLAETFREKFLKDDDDEDDKSTNSNESSKKEEKQDDADEKVDAGTVNDQKNAKLEGEEDAQSVSQISDDNEESEHQIIKKIFDNTLVVVHSTKCNNGRTTDGIEAGGARVAMEVNQLIQDLLALNAEEHQGKYQPRLSLSFVGNSLGGLYARSALSKIQWELPDGLVVHPIVFCTTCTPHLGKKGMTYLPLPRLAEQGLGYALQPTGQDLFGLNNQMEKLATNSDYVKPLQAFQKRVLYANAFGTDLQVPTATAAFLADTDSPHVTQDNHGKFLLTVTTPRNDGLIASELSKLEAQKASKAATATSPSNSDQNTNGEGSTDESPAKSAATPPPVNEFEASQKRSSWASFRRASSSNLEASDEVSAETMAKILDAMGWTKVFCDVRENLISVPIPFKKETKSEFASQPQWTSKELKGAVASNLVHDNKWPVPFGHTMLIANAKSDLYAKINKGGLPFVEQLARNLLDDIIGQTNQTTSGEDGGK